jgi:hypothetical protein
VSDLRDLLNKATPGPWIRPWGTHKIHQAFGMGSDHIGLPQSDLDLIVASVNALPALLDVVEAARQHADVTHADIPSLIALREAIARLDGAS